MDSADLMRGELQVTSTNGRKKLLGLPLDAIRRAIPPPQPRQGSGPVEIE